MKLYLVDIEEASCFHKKWKELKSFPFSVSLSAVLTKPGLNTLNSREVECSYKNIYREWLEYFSS